jgi:1-deoxy-D-xylulose-5-phosphate synthase
MVLDRINSPADLKGLSVQELARLASEIREYLVKTVSANGGHLASSLGVVELTIVLHRIFNSPDDKIIWDVGHQCYAHKLLTGRKDTFSTLRQYQGISGFPVREESPHDVFGAGHAGTSISAALGMAVARDLRGLKNNVIAIIGDGSIGAGMALEAINHAGHLGTKIIVVLNDNGMSISPSVGAVARILNQVRFDPRYESAKNTATRTITHLPFGHSVLKMGKQIKSRVKNVLLPNTLWEHILLPNIFWEQFGFTYLGPIDGHNILELEAALGRARDFEFGPTLVHVLTRKGKGHAPAEADAGLFHGLSPKGSVASDFPSYSRYFGNTVSRLMHDDNRIVAISAAMLDGTGLASVATEFPGRVFDVGICEQHAVTLAAGLATQGFIPIVAIYSTFLQRAYDQIVHDVCLQELPVVFAIDRAGIVGEDGKTHQGALDISFLRSIPNMIVSAPRDEDEFQHLLYTAVSSGRPMAVRFPRGGGQGAPISADMRRLPIGKGELLREGDDLAIIAIGATVYPALEAAARLEEDNIRCTVADARFAKPIDAEMVNELAAATCRLVTVEENALAGGFGSAVLELVSATGRHDVRVECLGLPDHFIEHGSQATLRSVIGLDPAGIARAVKSAYPELLARTKS